jgi:hypothetical protein
LFTVEGGREVRSSDLRGVEVEALIEAIVPLFTLDGAWHEDGSFEGVEYLADSDSEHFRKARRAVQQVRRSARRRVTPELLGKVAEVYRDNPERPAESVELAFGVSARTAFRYIAEARERGLLEPREG